MNEPRAHRIKRLKMRAMRRGIREMDLILTAYADATLENMAPETMDLFDAMLGENDQDLYQWVTGQVTAPARYRELIADVAQIFQK